MSHLEGRGDSHTPTPTATLAAEVGGGCRGENNWMSGDRVRFPAPRPRVPTVPQSQLCSHTSWFSCLSWGEWIFWFPQPKAAIISFDRSSSFRSRHDQAGNRSKWQVTWPTLGMQITRCPVVWDRLAELLSGFTSAGRTSWNGWRQTGSLRITGEGYFKRHFRYKFKIPRAILKTTCLDLGKKEPMFYGYAWYAGTVLPVLTDGLKNSHRSQTAK